MRKYILVTLVSTLFLSLNTFSSTFTEENQMVESTYRPALDTVDKLQTKLLILEQEKDLNTEVSKFIQELIKYQSLNKVEKIDKWIHFKEKVSRMENLGGLVSEIDTQLTSLDLKSGIVVQTSSGEAVDNSQKIAEYMIKNEQNMTEEEAKTRAGSLVTILTYQNKYLTLKNRLDSWRKIMEFHLQLADAELSKYRKYTPY